MVSAERTIAELVRNTDLSPADLRDALASFLWTGEGDFPLPLRDEPHALGWLQQYLGEAQRRSAFEAHTARETKHSTATVTTQLYTPRWVADWLAQRCLDLVDRHDVTVLDPACGGGQMLLAAADLLIARGLGAPEAFGRLHGIDLDPDAVWACRESLKLAAARAAGGRDGELEARIDTQIRVGDGLLDATERATIVLTNPPYMGTRSMSPALKATMRSFEPFHHDLYLAFIRRCSALADGAMGVLAQQTIWYLKRFEAARKVLLEEGRLCDFAHLGHGVFDGLSGEKATVVAFTWQPDAARSASRTTRFWDLRDADDKRSAIEGPPQVRDVAAFAAIPASPLAFWLPERLIRAFEGPRVGDIALVPGSQNKTGDNRQYVCAIGDAPPGWVPYSKGGRFAPWWGNWDWAVDWSDSARAFYAGNPTSNLLDERWWFREGLCYSDFGGRHFNARWMPPGCVFDMAGPAIFEASDDLDVLAALMVVLNSTAAREVLNALNPTLHYQVRDVRNLPLPDWSDPVIARLAALGHALVDATRDALENGGEAPGRLELEADRIVAEAYGSPDLVEAGASRRVHHRLEHTRRST